MNCPESQDLLQQRLDGLPVASPPGLEQHLRECGECRERHAAARRLAEALVLWSRPASSPDLAARIAGQVLAEREVAGRFRRRVIGWTAAAAALMLLALGGYQVYRATYREDAGPEPRMAHRDHEPNPDKGNRETSRPQQEPSLRQTVDEAGTAALNLTRRTARQTVAQARRWLPHSSPFAVPGTSGKTKDPLTPALEPPAESLREAGQGVTAGLRPVTTSARRAVNLFLGEFSEAGSGSSGF